MQRTGTTWLARLLADSFKVPSLSRHWRWDGEQKTDTVIHGLRRKGYPVRRGHWAAHNYPYPESPVVTIVRDPRDQAVSSFYYREEEKLHDHALWLMGTHGEKWCDYLVGWWMVNAPFVRYKDLHGDTYGVLVKLIPQLGLELPPTSDIRKAVRNNDFKTMEKRGKKHILMRRGLVGEWREIMEPKTANLIKERCADIMEFFGYD